MFIKTLIKVLNWQFLYKYFNYILTFLIYFIYIYIYILKIFGIPGDYVLDFVRLIEKFPGISFINTCDENGAAIAADTYARINKVNLWRKFYIN